MEVVFMSKALSIGLLVVGVLLLIYGISAAGSFSSDVSRAVTGTPTDRSIWLIALGALAGIVGLVGLVRGR
jgi:hypothetical protein